MSIGARLRQLRKANKLSGERFGDLCGVTKGTVSQWESDLTTPMLDRLIDLHKHLDFSFDWLLDGKETQATAYTTSDPTLVKMLQVLEPRAEYLKDAAYKAAITTCELVDQAKAVEQAPPPIKTYRPPDRRLGLHFYGGIERRAGKKNVDEK